MEHLTALFPLFITLTICTFNGYSMCSYRLPTKQTHLCFLAMTLFCLAVNSYIGIRYGVSVYRKWMLFTIAFPYFLMIQFISKDKISQTFFNFWLWINIFSVINTMAHFVNDITFRNYRLMVLLRVLLFCCYFVLYHKYIKKHHRLVIEKLNVNWWLFSLIPALFTILLSMINQYYGGKDVFSHNYPLLFIIFTLMAFVYVIIGYTFRTMHTSMKLELSQTVLSQQLNTAKEEISFLNETKFQTSMYQHNMRHHLNAIDGFLSADKPQQAKEYIRKVQADVESIIPKRFCENELVNLLCSSFSRKAEQMGIPLKIKANLSKIHSISDTELCAVLSNGLENALHAVSVLESRKWAEMRCEVKHNKLLIEIKNPYSGEILMQDGLPVSSNENHGYGCYSIRAIVEQHQGVCAFEAKNAIFTLRIALPLQDEMV